MTLPKRYHGLKKAKTQTWYEGVIKGCEIILTAYREEEEGSFACPFCILDSFGACKICPWIIYGEGERPPEFMIACGGYSQIPFPDRIKRLDGWIRRSKRGLKRLKKWR